MVSRLERWAEDARANGHPDEGTIIAGLAKVFIKAGVPEEFPQEAVESSVGRNRTKELSQEGIRTRLIKAMSSVEMESKGRVLTHTLARTINQEVGQYLSDETNILGLCLPNGRMDRRVEQLNTRLRVTYNHAIRRLNRAHFSTVGLIRDTDIFTIKDGRSIGDITTAFAKTAFARPQARN